ncbi:hypothetical protein [Nocardioides sediminis]|uniref:hypothetical protein n=1 Tax=Nocardioides sediminis TaxID=433648 RepID=UPI000D30861F|nr:hypothetical protein [Nocardioides sediminis]
MAHRHEVGAAIAALVLAGAAGALSPLVVGEGADTARDPRPVRPATSAPTWTGGPDVAPPADVLRSLVAPEEMGRRLLAATAATGVEQVAREDDGSGDLARLYHLTVEGAQVSFYIRWYNSPVVVQDGGRPLTPSHICEQGVEDDCTTLPDGSRLLREETFASGGTGVPDTFLQRHLVLATTDGWQVDVTARNTTGEKDGEIVTDEPVLAMAEMQELATSTEWYE